MHGGRGSGAPKGIRNGRYKNGCFTGEAKALMDDLNMLARMLKRLRRSH
jgi:hypothetical protein